MNGLTVFYDRSCGFCLACRRWLERQPAFLPLRFVPSAGLPPALLAPVGGDPSDAEDLIVVSDEGGIYRGARGWIMCLWALREYRGLSERLATPALMPFARRAFEFVSRNRMSFSRRLGLLPESDLAETLGSLPAPTCALPAPQTISFERR